MSGIVMSGLSGCLFHKRVKPQPVVLAPQAPVPLETPSGETRQPVLETPKAPLPPVPVATEAPKPKRRRRRPARATPTPTATAPAAGDQVPAGTAEATPSQPAPGTDPAGVSGLGDLTPGGVGQSPEARKEARDLLITTDRRLRGLPAATQSRKKVEVSQIRNFWKQASDALQSGDAQGAKTLATKAKLLLDDLERAE